MVEAFEYLSECALSDLFDDLEAESDLIVLGYAVIAVAVVVPVVDDPLGLGRVYLELVRG